MAWSYCEDFEGSCASCAGYGEECNFCPLIDQRSANAKENRRCDGFSTFTCDCSVGVTDRIVGVACTAVHIYDAHSAMKFLQPVLPTNHGSSEPVTPFNEFIDRALVGATFQEQQYVAPAADTQPPSTESPLENGTSHSHSTTDPAYISSYRAAAEPLSDWIAGYAWKVCTTGIGLPDRFARHGPRPFDVNPPTRLAHSIRNMLWSTLLQPSGVFLAMWYITHLPVHLDWLVLDGSISPQEHMFRVELMEGMTAAQGETDTWEGQVVFRLVLLGCMLANKWLDDHTFSNKTWHSITEVPIDAINRLELLALSLMKHDLSISQGDWQNWLCCLRQHDTAIWPYPSPIRRPSANDPSIVVRDAIEGLLQLYQNTTTSSPGAVTPVPLPSFTRLLSGSKARGTGKQQDVFDPFEINLDEDGPLRDEYVPRRRSLRGPRHKPSPPTGFLPPNGEQKPPPLPPPASWSPHADPPIERTQPQLPRHSRTGSFSDSTSGSRWPAQVTSVLHIGKFLESSTRIVDDQLSSGIYNEAVRPPTSHTRSTSVMSACNGPSIAHARTFSSQVFYDNCYGTAPLPHGYFGFPSTNVLGHDDPTHFRPLWLRT